MTYREALAEIIGKDNKNFGDMFFGGVSGCPCDAFDGISERCPDSDFIYLNDKCGACWNREYQGEEFIPEYLGD